MIEPKMGMEVPAQVREFAEKSVDQAEKAFDAFIDAANKSASMIPNPTTETSKKSTVVYGNEHEGRIRSRTKATARKRLTRSRADSD